MRKIHVAGLCAIFFVWFAVVGWAADKPAPVKFAGGEYQIVEDSLLVSLVYPLANNRETIVGNYVPGKSGGQALNMDQDKDLLDYARTLREQLLAVKTSTSLFAVRSVIVQYNQIIVTRYPGVEWEVIVKPLEAALAEIAKTKKLPAAKK
jgi:hypothetical protein